MKKALFVISLLLASCFPSAFAATDEGYGEDQTALGQFVDSFENLNNVSVRYQVERNTTLNAMELNYSTGIFIYRDFGNHFDVNVSYLPFDNNITLPVLLNISVSSGMADDDVSHIFDEVGDSYLKIAATNREQDYEYYMEVEDWDSINEVAEVWISINVTDKAFTLNSTIRFFYDGSALNNTAFVGLPGSAVAWNVWDDDFVAVYHLTEDAGDFIDSTSNQINASEQGNGVTRGNYIIDGGIDVAGTNDYARVDQIGILGGYDDITVEAWINADAYGGVDKAVMGDWGAAETFLLYYDAAPNNRWRWLVRDNGGAAKSAFFGAQPPVAGTQYYLAGSYERNDKMRAWQNGVLTNGAATANQPTETAISKIAIGEEVDGGAKDWNGKIDEVRFSKIDRKTAYVNGTYYTGIDQLLDWFNFTFGGMMGYALDGCFTTDDYLNDTVCNGTTLGLMINSTIPGNTDIQVQFSNDNATWGDWEGIPLDSNILQGGFEIIDLRYLNETDLFIRFNLSTIDVAFTPRIYQSRLISTIGNSTGGAAVGPSGGGAIGLIMLILISSPIIVLIVWWSKKR